MAKLQSYQHGKSKVRLGRVWRDGARHTMVEWLVNISLESECDASFTGGDNSGIVATDTMKNTVYVLAKDVKSPTSPEEFCLKLARHFVDFYSVVTKAKVGIIEKPWVRAEFGGQTHDHGYVLGSEKHTAYVEMDKEHASTVVTGLEDFAVLKTTQAAFNNFIHDSNTTLPDTDDRIVATSVTAKWTYSSAPEDYGRAYEGVKELLSSSFFGPPKGGVFSPSVQSTLYLMAQAVLDRHHEVESVYLNMPNLHFLPVKMPAIGIEFNNDVYLPTSEPHGTIEATVTRGASTSSHSRL